MTTAISNACIFHRASRAGVTARDRLALSPRTRLLEGRSRSDSVSWRPTRSLARWLALEKGDEIGVNEEGRSRDAGIDDRQHVHAVRDVAVDSMPVDHERRLTVC